MSDRTDDLLDEIVRLLALQVRQGAETQADAIALFDQAGIKAPRIAELVGTTPATVRTAVQRSRKTAAKPKPSKGQAK